MRNFFPGSLPLLLLLAALFLLSSSITGVQAATGRERAPHICLGIQGNGFGLWAHFGAMARIVEVYNLPIDCVGGGSSGSVTAFIVESIQMNPILQEYPVGSFGRQAREAFLYKSMLGAIKATLLQDGVDALELVLGGSSSLFEGIDVLMVIREILSLPPITRGVILSTLGLLASIYIDIDGNLSLLRQSPDPRGHIEELLMSLREDGILSGLPGDFIAYLRPGQVDYEGLIGFIGALGNFYATRGGRRFYKEKQFRGWLDACAEASFGMSWEEASQLPVGRSSNCQDEMTDLFRPYRAVSVFRDSEERPDRRWDRPRVGIPESRLDDPVGMHQPVLLLTAIVTGDTYDQLKRAQAFYNAAQFDNITWNPNFEDDVRFGYIGNMTDLMTIQEGLARDYPDDLRASLSVPLGQTPWADALYASTSEPGLTNFVELPGYDNLAVMGGWPDTTKTPVLNMLGADHTITMIADSAGTFSRQGLETLGANESIITQLEDRSINSSYTVGLAAADARVCVQWYGINFVNFTGFFDAGYYYQLIETTDPFFSNTTYENVADYIGIVGCTPLVGPTDDQT